MIEPAVTVVRCRVCRHSERLTLTEGRFWCAWCQRWTEIDAEQVLGAEVILDGDNFRLAPVTQPKDWQQPLRVPPGWRIELNSFAAEDIDGASVAYFGGRDLFFATHDRLQCAVDLEWRTEPDQPVIGCYVLRVHPFVPRTQEEQQRQQGPALVVNWHVSLHEFETTSRLALVAELEACLRGERGEQ